MGPQGTDIVMKARSALSIQRDVIFAIFLREMNARFRSYTFGNVWIILDPIIMIMVFIALFGLRGRGEFGYAEPAVFIAAAYVPFRMLWQNTLRQNMGADKSVKGLLGFRQVRLFDLFMARTIVEGGIYIVAGIVIVALLMWVGFDAMPSDLLATLFYSSLLWLFAAFFGILACVVASFAREVQKLIGLLTLPLLFLSAVFYPMTMIPPEYQRMLAKNPLVHANELIREAWLENYISPVADLGNLAAWILCTAAIAVASYRLRWQRMLAR